MQVGGGISLHQPSDNECDLSRNPYTWDGMFVDINADSSIASGSVVKASFEDPAGRLVLVLGIYQVRKSFIFFFRFYVSSVIAPCRPSVHQVQASRIRQPIYQDQA